MSALKELATDFEKSPLKIKVESLSENILVISFIVRARPGAKVIKAQVAPSGELLLWVRAKAQEGAANAALCEMIASIFGVSKSAAALEKGARGREKRFTVCFEKKDNKPTSFYQEKLQKLLETT